MTWNEILNKSDEIFGQFHKAHIDFYNLWKSEILLSWRWWIAVTLILIPWIVWFTVRRKERADRLLYAGFFVMLCSAFLDVIGIALNLWSYPVNVVPLMPEFIPFDISTLPVTIMLSIQILPRVKPILKAFVTSLVGSFIFQPLMSAAGLYNKMSWKDYYSVPILIAIYMGANYFYNRNQFEKPEN